MPWTQVKVKDTKGRVVSEVGGGDPKRVHKLADERMKRGYTKSVRTTDC